MGSHRESPPRQPGAPVPGGRRRVSSLDPGFVDASLERLRAGAGRWRRRPVADRIGVLASASMRLGALAMASDSKLLNRLEVSTGYSVPVLRAGIGRLTAAVTHESLRNWWGRRGDSTPAQVPATVAVIPAGNIPGVGYFPAVAALLVGAGVLIKQTRAEPWLMPAWWEVLGAIDPDAAATVTLLEWAGGEDPVEDRLLGSFDRLLAFGRDRTMERLAARYAGRVEAFGTGLSFGLVDGDGAARSGGLMALARDIALWDQQGCLSPQWVWVSGGREVAERVAAELALAFEQLEAEWPRGRLSAEEAGRVRAWQGELEARRLAGEPVTLRTPVGSLAWSIATADDPGFEPTPLNRTLWVRPVSGVGAVAAVLESLRRQLQGAALLVAPDREAEYARRLRTAGVHFVTRAGLLQDPPVDWPNKGIDLLARMAGEEPE